MLLPSRVASWTLGLRGPDLAGGLVGEKSCQNTWNHVFVLHI